MFNKPSFLSGGTVARKYIASYTCLKCNRNKDVRYRCSEEYERVMVCPECMGAMVDSNRVGMCRSRTDHIKSSPLLVIELGSIDSAPKVVYNGECIEKNIRVTFDFVTNDQNSTYPTFIHIETLEDEGNTKRIQHNQPIGK